MAKENKTDVDKVRPIPLQLQWNFLRISLAAFLNDLPGYGQSGINGWQIRLIDAVDDLVGFQFVMVSSTGSTLLSTIADMSKFYHLLIYDFLPNFIDPEPIGQGHFEQSKITSRKIDFYYLTKENLDMLLVNSPTHLYFSKVMVDFGPSISSRDNDRFSLLKIECKDDNTVIRYSTSDRSEFPLYALAPACPPAWNKIFATLPGYEVVNTSQSQNAN